MSKKIVCTKFYLILLRSNVKLRLYRIIYLSFIKHFFRLTLFMTASFLPPILTPVVTLFFPGLVFALFFVLIEQEEIA